MNRQVSQSQLCQDRDRGRDRDGIAARRYEITDPETISRYTYPNYAQAYHRAQLENGL
jgi:hypothetical protein